MSLMIGKKILYGLLSAAVLASLPAFSAVQVQNGRILLGTAFQFSSNSPAEFECRIINPDPKPHRVMIRLQTSSGFSSGQNVNSPEFEIPSRSAVTCRVPVMLASDEKFTYVVFEDGRRRPSSVVNECEIKYPDGRTAGIGILNDLGEIPGNFKQNRFLSRPMFNVSFRGHTLPRHREIYRSLHALLILHPDFSGWTSEQFAAVLEYVADGGLAVFADPEGILAAAETPLAALLPVMPAGIRMVPVARLTGSARESLREVKYLDSAALTDRLNDPASLTAVRECRYGFGTVRLLPFSPIRENFPDDPVFADRLFAELLNAPVKEQAFSSFRGPLDKLTGFTVPRTGSVRNILLVYFGLLLVIVVIGFRRKRHVLTWLACALTAVVATAAILIHVSRSLGKRGSLAAVLRVENAAQPGIGKTYFSLFSPASMTATVQSERARGLFESVPLSGLQRFQMAYVGSASPLDLRVMPDDRMQVRDVNLAARSSRQFMENTSPSAQPGNAPGWKAPRLRLSRNGLRLEPWRVPGPAPEAVFVLFPNGSKLADLSLNGTCEMKNSDSALADPLVEDLRRALEKSHSKRHPGVVVISKNTTPHPGLDPKFQVQGKTLTVYPADLRCDPGRLTVPTELLVLSPAETGSRLALDGGRLNPDYTLQVSMSVVFNLAPALALPSSIRYSSAEVKVSISGSDRIEPVIRLNTASGSSVKGRKIASGEYVFDFKDSGQLFAWNRPARLSIEGVLKKRKGGDQDYSVNNWSVLDLQIRLHGEMIENKEKLP